MEDPPPATPLQNPRTASANPKRRSLPTGTSSSREGRPRRSANHIRHKPASPEVISSLIDSLSAISLPAQDHFENLPRIGGDAGPSYSVPASPAPWQGGFQNGNGGFGVEYGVHRHERWEEERKMEPDHDDAAEPPVIKTAPPPSGYSPITAPTRHKRDKEGSSLKNYILSTSKSCSSLNSKHSSNRDDASSITSSIARGLRRHSTNSRASLESKRSATKTRSLGYASSRERLRSRDSDSIGVSSPPQALWSPPKSTSGPPSPRKPSLQSLRGSRIDEAPCEGPSTPPRRTKHKPAPINTTPGPAEADERGPRWPDDSIPSRTSSLRHQSRSPAKHRRISSRSRSRTQSKTRTVIEEDEPMETSPDPKGKGKQKADESEQEEDTEVTRRIKELKKQKELRDKEAGNLRLDIGGEVQEPPRLSPSMRTPLSPITRALEFDGQRPIEESLAKAHRMLGLTPTEMRRSLTSPLPLGDGAQPTQPEQNGELKNDAEDDLPIDYKLALQSLDRTESEKTSSSNPSNRLSLASMGRSHTIAGRPSAGSNTMSTMMKERNKRSLEEAAHKLDLQINFDTPAGSRAPSRAASAESTPSSRQSLFVPSTSSLKRSNSSANAKKKRWSHPDIPLKAEQKHNAKVDQMKRDSMQVKSPVKSPQVPEAVIEEPLRPTSGDSIDDEVDAFLYSPRLTQKVREPNTGRTICFSEVGDPDGFAVFVCVGMGLTRYVTAFYDELATSLKLRLITPDRPGVGESQADPHGTPLSWPDDVLCICQALKITKFSIMAHSAGAIYALATALRMPQHIRGRVHLLAPWIPPSQMTAVGLPVNAQVPERQLPRSQRFLRVLPTPLLKVANSSFMSATSASITRSVPKSPQRVKRRSYVNPQQPTARVSVAANKNRESMMLMDRVLPNGSALEVAANNPDDPNHEAAAQARAAMTLVEQERRREYDTRLTLSVWDMATTNANPAVDLLVCLERTQSIGFRYVDITRAVVIHHGSRDTRVPVENVKWLGRTMKRCEVRILEGENHGLMASAVVMGNVLTEMAREWEDWTAVVKDTRSRDNLRGEALSQA